MIRKEFEGRTYLVVPVVMMIADRYLPGSLGETWYSSERMAFSANFWNGVPLVLNHPYRGGQYVSAHTPDILQQSKVGFVFNVQFDSKKLIGEAWIDVERARQLDQRLVIAIQQGNLIEVSTGLYTDITVNADGKNEAVGCWMPDHLAILLDTTGACSVHQDGCGLGRR